MQARIMQGRAKREKGDKLSQGTSYVGIDISKDSLDIAVHASDKQWCFSNDPSGIKRAAKVLMELEPSLVVFEATGGFELPLWFALTEAGMKTSPANPRQVRDFAKGAGKLAKTDKIDARLLARFAEAVHPAPTVLPSEEEQLLSALIARRTQLIDFRTAEDEAIHRHGSSTISMDAARS
jgi:transposase